MFDHPDLVLDLTHIAVSSTMNSKSHFGFKFCLKYCQWKRVILLAALEFECQ